MKQKLFLLFLTFYLSGNSQTIFPHEKEINNKEKYTYREINFKNTDKNRTLSGTLITPKSDFDKVVIIVPGTGMDTRHSHFLLAEEFLKNGIAVYRFDEPLGLFYHSPSPLVSDLTFLVSKLRKDELISSLKIGMLGHSLGGFATIALYKKKKNIDFLIQMSTVVEKGVEFFKYQAKQKSTALYYVHGKSLAQSIELLDLINHIIIDNEDSNTIYSKVDRVAKENGLNDELKKFLLPEYMDFVRQNNELTYKNINIPVLFIIGSIDRYVDSKSEIKLLKSFNNPNIKIKLMNDLTHYLTTKSIKSKYQMDKTALNEIINWTLIN